MPAPGDTYLFDPDLLGGTNHHLWVVVHVYTPELDTTEYAILVNLTTPTGKDDRTCVVGSNEHQFLVHQSVVFYAKAREVETSCLPDSKKHHPTTDALLTKIILGLHASPHTKRGIKRKVPQR